MSVQTEPAPAPLGDWVTPRPARPLEVLLRILTLPALIRAHWDLVRTTLRRDLAARFHGTLLGWAWPVLQPLLLFGVYYFIFSELLQIKMPGLPEDKKAAMGVYMFVGMIAWAMLADSLTRGTSVIVDNGNLIKKLAFPCELLPLNVVLSSLVLMLFAVAIFVLATLATPVWPAPSWSVLWVPVLCVLQSLFAYGLVLLLSTLQVFLRDTSQVVAVVTTVWMFLTPIFWVPALLGEAVEDYTFVIEGNPTYHMIAAWRGALMGDLSVAVEIEAGVTRVYHPVVLDAIPWHVGVFALWAAGAYALGYAFFVMSQRRFADEV